MKKILIALAVVVCLFVATVATLLFVVEPNQFKPLIVKEVKSSTGLDLSIQGDLDWTFFPSFGLEMGKIELKNPAGFQRKNLATVDNVSVSVAVLPLLSHQLQIGQVKLNGADIQLEKLANGLTNYKMMTAKADHDNSLSDTSSSPSVETTPKAVKQDSVNWSVEVNGIDINHAKFAMLDQQAGSKTAISDLSLTVSAFQFAHWTPFTFHVTGAKDEQQFSSQGEGEFKIDSSLKQYELQRLKVTSSLHSKDLKIEQATISSDHLAINKPSLIAVSAQMQAKTFAGNVSGQMTLNVDAAFNEIRLTGLALKGELKGSAVPNQKMKFDLNSVIQADIQQQKVHIAIPQFVVNDMVWDGQIKAENQGIMQVRYDLHAYKLDLDQLLASSQQDVGNQVASEAKDTSKQPEVNRSAQPTKAVEPDLSILNQIDVAGDIRLDKFKLNNAVMTNLTSSIAVNKGAAVLKSFNADMYDGKVFAQGSLVAGKTPSYSLKADIKDIQVQPLLEAVADNNILEGTGNIVASVKGRSLIPNMLKKNLNGNVEIDFADGAINGINIPRLIRVNYAKFKGETISDQDTVQKTDFSSLTSTIALKSGIASTNNFEMSSPLLRVHGEGNADYIQRTQNFLVRTSVVKSLEGQGGKGIDDLRDVTIPIKVTGSWDKPKYRLVFDDVMKTKAEKEVDRGLKKLDSKIKNPEAKKAINSLLKGLFN